MKIWTKICGITRVEDAEAAASLGVDAIGINFYPASIRCCPAERAADITSALRGSKVTVYGVFVRETVARIAELVDTVGLTGVQLHGEESDSEVERVRGALAPGLAVIRAVSARSSAAVKSALAGAAHWRVLLDSPRGGGSGTRFDESAVSGVDLSQAIVAGGLTPENVAEVVGRLHPYGVDTASGVERERGVKDRERMREFIEHANAAAA